MTSLDRTDATAVDMMTRDLLSWLCASSRTYAEAMEAWRTSCPRLPIWENALDDGLIRIEQETGKPVAHAEIALTARGRAALDGVVPETDATAIVGS
ncbi:MAG: hypothetical protein ACRDJC_08880 [Thermomicrobiales bacterium]